MKNTPSAVALVVLWLHGMATSYQVSFVMKQYYERRCRVLCGLLILMALLAPGMLARASDQPQDSTLTPAQLSPANPNQPYRPYQTPAIPKLPLALQNPLPASPSPVNLNPRPGNANPNVISANPNPVNANPRPINAIPNQVSANSNQITPNPKSRFVFISSSNNPVGTGSNRAVTNLSSNHLPGPQYPMSNTATFMNTNSPFPGPSPMWER